MSLTKKAISILLVISIIFTLAACGGNSGGSSNSNDSGNEGTDGKTTLHLWHLWSTETDSMRIATEKVAKEYMEANPNVNIEIHILENEAYKTKISTEFAGSAKGIDLFYYWGGGRGGKLALADKLLPIGDYLDEETLPLLKPGSTQAFEYSGKLYALPTYSWAMMLYCNNDLFQQAGAKIPTTYEELLDASKKLSDAGITPIAQGIKEGWQAAFVYEALALREVGASNINKMLNGEASFDDNGYLVAAQKVKELYDAGAFGKNPLEVASPDADSMFYSGRAAMRLTGNWFTDGVYTDKNSVLQEDGKVTAINIPMSSSANAKETDYCGGFIEGFFINKNTANPEIAVDFNIYLSKELAKARHESGQGFTGWTIPVDESSLKPLAKEVAAIVAKNVDGVVAWDTALDENTAATHLEEVQTLFTSGANPDAVFEAHKDILNK